MTVRLSPKWTERLLSLPESGMGYQVVDVTLRDGKTLSGLAVFNGQDIEPPPAASFDASDIVRIELHDRDV